MPIYSFFCKDESHEESYYFELSMSMSDDRSNIKCPECNKKESVKRIFSTPPITMGLTANQKSAGTTKHRADLGQFMKDQRSKRKKEFEPGTIEHDSNELWAGNHLPDGVKAPPKPVIKLTD